MFIQTDSPEDGQVGINLTTYQNRSQKNVTNYIINFPSEVVFNESIDICKQNYDTNYIKVVNMQEPDDRGCKNSLRFRFVVKLLF